MNEIVTWDERPEGQHWAKITEIVATYRRPFFYSLEENACESWGVLISSEELNGDEIRYLWKDWVRG